MEMDVISTSNVNKNLPCLETGLGLKLSSFLIYVLKQTKKNLSMLTRYFTMLEKHRLLILLKEIVNGEKLYFMKVILLYLVLESWVLEHFRMLEAPLSFFISIYGL